MLDQQIPHSFGPVGHFAEIGFQIVILANGIGRDVCNVLADRNDGTDGPCLAFPEIADWIEANVVADGDEARQE